MKFFRFLSLVLLSLLISPKIYPIDCTPPDCTSYELKNGIIWYHKKYSDLLGGPQNVNIIDIDNNNPHITIKPVYKISSSCEKTSSMGERTGAIAGINGGFFDGANGCAPLGLLKIDDKIISYAVSYRPPRSALGIQIDKTILFRRTDSKDSFPEAINALGGMPNLVRDGEKYLTTNEEEANSIAGVNPRTAICKASGNHFLMITIDGRATGRTGMDLEDLAQYLLWLGCEDGINLDGGGSTTMWVNGSGVVNYPSDGSQRYVSNGLFVFYSDNLPPVIEHNPILESPRTNIVILAKVTDDNGVKAVNLKFRNIGQSTFISRNMIDRGNNIYEATIFVDEITSAMVQYYIAAWDGALRTLLPLDAEREGHYFEIKISGSQDAGFDTDLNEDKTTFIDTEYEDTYFADIAFFDEVSDVYLFDVENLDIFDIDILEDLTDTKEFIDSYTDDGEIGVDIIDPSDSYSELMNNRDIENSIDNSNRGCSCNIID